MKTAKVTRRTLRSVTRRLPREIRGKQLLDIAEEMFVTRGYEMTTLEDVVRAAGVTRPIVYEHYKSKEGLFLACAARARAQFEHDVAEFHRTTKSTDVYELFWGAGDVFFRMLESSPRRWKLLFGNTSASSGELADGIARLRFGAVERTASQIRARAPGSDESAIMAASFVIFGVGEQLGQWWLLNPNMSRSTVLWYYAQFITGGIERVQARLPTKEKD